MDNHLKIGDLLFIRGNSIISKLINKVDGEFSHIAIYIGNDNIIEAQRFTRSRITTIKFDDYEVVRLNLKDYQRILLMQNVNNLIGYRYDYKQVFDILMKKLFKWYKGSPNNRENFICSELIVEALSLCKYLSEEEKEEIIDSTPNELYKYILQKWSHEFYKNDKVD